ncbi:hypothetical protein [Microbacterium sp. NPDC064584]|uniref:hypothetical protein n=1 Tax=Microbacterium sp. NPDC064584 TaxID=3155817 RepID=UPI0034342853
MRVNDLTAPIQHVPGHTMQVDWAGTRMQIVDPVSGQVTPVSVFVASLPYSGLVFAYGCLDEKFPAWADAHRRAFEYIEGVTLLVVPDNASTASNQISKSERARDVNSSYAQFLEHYRTAAVPTRSAAPRDYPEGSVIPSRGRDRRRDPGGTGDRGGISSPRPCNRNGASTTHELSGCACLEE